MTSPCRTGCKTKDHATYGECLRDANPRVAYCGKGGGDATAQKKWDGDIKHYFNAINQGIQPAGTKRHQVDAAIRQANETGKAAMTPKTGAQGV